MINVDVIENGRGNVEIARIELLPPQSMTRKYEFPFHEDIILNSEKNRFYGNKCWLLKIVVDEHAMIVT